jgi:hypothetical protein
MKRLVIGLVLLVMLVLIAVPASATTIEYFPYPQEGNHTGFVIPTDTYANNAAVLSGMEAEAEEYSGVAWADMTDFQKAWEMTKFIRRHGLRADTPKLGSHEIIVPANLSTILNAMQARDYGYVCTGHAFLLMDMASLEGFDTYTIFAGNLGVSWTHATTLIKCNISGHEKWCLFDPYFGDCYIYANATGMSFFQMQDYIENEEYSNIYRRTIGAKYDMYTLTNSTYDYNPGDTGLWASSSNICNTLIETNTTGDYRLWRTNNWFLTAYVQATTAQWTQVYENPYELFDHVYAVYDTSLTYPPYDGSYLATLEAEET